MSAPEPAGSNAAPPVVELRQYRLRPGRRDELIELFDRELVETQEATGMTVIGQFRDLDRADYFVWLRGFTGMGARQRSLEAFYGGSPWRQHSAAANATMLEIENVLLLRPSQPGAGFSLPGAETRDQGVVDDRGGVVVIIQHRVPGRESEMSAFLDAKLRSELEASGATTIGVYETDPSTNTFPALPVRHDANVLAWFGRVDDLGQGWPTDLAAGAPAAWPADVLRLAPTPRSLLGRPR